MIFGSHKRYCITFRMNEPNFSIHSRNDHHEFQIKISDQNLEGCQGLDAGDAFIVSKKDKIQIFDSSSFSEISDPL